MKMLLEREDVNPDQPDTLYAQAPLSRAAQTGYEGAVKMLLERKDVNSDQPDTSFPPHYQIHYSIKTCQAGC